MTRRQGWFRRSAVLNPEVADYRAPTTATVPRLSKLNRAEKQGALQSLEQQILLGIARA